ncbi:O-methyltransferase [Paenibacillus glucanolyticus]|uniref:O-methyltransferase n=1 Tax=Paenibacillus glucanolyticus TaxID=59843 RepID=UPI0036BD8976
MFDLVESVPKIVKDAHARASEANFHIYCNELVGRLLAVLAASVSEGGSILEIGTGVGVGTAWIASGLSGNKRVRLITIENKPERAAHSLNYNWPIPVSIITGDYMEYHDKLGKFDLIFADAAAGKWSGLELTIASLKSGGILIVDDMAPPFHSQNEEVAKKRVEDRLFHHPELLSVKIDIAGGIIISTKTQE